MRKPTTTEPHSMETVPPNQINTLQLYPADQKHVNQFLTSGVNAIERPPFRPIRMMLWLTLIIIILGLISRLIGLFVLPS